MLYPIPIAIFTAVGLLFLFFPGRARGLKAIFITSYSGIIIFSFTGGASGGVWLAPLFLYLVGLVVIWRPKGYAFNSKRMYQFTCILLWVYAIGVIVGLLRFDPSLEAAKEGSFKTFLGVPIQYLMAIYRFYTIFFLFLAFVLPLRYYIDRSLFLKFLMFTWIFGVIFAVFQILDFFRIGNFAFTSYRLVTGYAHRGIMGFHRGAGGMMHITNLLMTFAMIQLTLSRILKTVGYTSLLLLIAGVIFSFSRTAMIAMIFGGASLAVTLGGARVIKGMLIALLGAIVVYVILMQVPELRERFSILFGGEGRSMEELSAGRIVGWGILIKWLLKSPGVLVFGAGFQNFLYFVTIQSGVGELMAGHNNYLHVLVEHGIFGLAIFLGWIISIFFWLISWRRTMTDKVDKMMPAIFMSYMLAILGVCMFSESLSPSYSITPFTVHFFLVMGIWVSYYRTQMAELNVDWEMDYLGDENEVVEVMECMEYV